VAAAPTGDGVNVRNDEGVVMNDECDSIHWVMGVDSKFIIHHSEFIIRLLP
jgi:hypothetical protein